MSGTHHHPRAVDAVSTNVSDLQEVAQHTGYHASAGAQTDWAERRPPVRESRIQGMNPETKSNNKRQQGNVHVD
jgi:hypothetical protein